MKEFISKLIGSLDNKQLSGFSGKKLTALCIVACVLAAHVKWITLGDFKQLEMVLTIDYSFIAVLFGINEYGKVKERKPEGQ
jgi:hypothetical protein